jgi:probable F420-dependent oxidoreductase
MAQALEEAGFDSIWVADHIVMPGKIVSHYPFSDDGAPAWPVDRPWHDAVIALALAIASTSRVEVGTAVLVLPLRHPVELAKQVATLDVESGGRMTLGVGVGWLAEEYEAMGLDFASRGERMSESLQVLRECWTGRPSSLNGKHFRLPPDVRCLPTPVHHVPILIGGNTKAALRRAAVEADGWLGLQRTGRFDIRKVAESIASVRSNAESVGRDPEALRIVLRIIESAGSQSLIANWLRELDGVGVTDVIVDVNWEPEDALHTVETLSKGMK